MISIIICSRKPDISIALKDNIKSTIGIDYEIIVVDNSNNEYSIFSAYNKGLSDSKYPYVCFVHEDVLFKTDNWGVNLINHLLNEKAGIIGVAGGKMMTKIPAPSWSIGWKNVHIIQHRKRMRKPLTVYIKEPRNFSGNCQSALLLDGVFLAMRHELFNQIKFDETLPGFHGYDIDICTQSVLAGYDNYVVYDILIEHFSEGNGNAQYFSNLIKIYKKWEEHLPLYCADVPDDIRAKTDQLNARNLAKVIRRLARTGFKTNEIINFARYYANLANTEETKSKLNFIRLKIIFERIFNSQS